MSGCAPPSTRAALWPFPRPGALVTEAPGGVLSSSVASSALLRMADARGAAAFLECVDAHVQAEDEFATSPTGTPCATLDDLREAVTCSRSGSKRDSACSLAPEIATMENILRRRASRAPHPRKPGRPRRKYNVTSEAREPGPGRPVVVDHASRASRASGVRH